MDDQDNPLRAKQTPKARLDPHGTEKPLTRIVQHVPINACCGPGIALRNPEYEGKNGERIPLDAPSMEQDLRELLRKAQKIHDYQRLSGYPTIGNDLLDSEVAAFMAKWKKP